MSAAIYQVVYIQEQDPYLGITKSDFQSPAVIALITFFRAMIAFQNIIPIALYISIDIAKTFQSYFIHRDLQAYDEATDSPVICQSWKLCDDLGTLYLLINRSSRVHFFR
jgi:phospholipid-translocating ATPase